MSPLRFASTAPVALSLWICGAVACTSTDPPREDDGMGGAGSGADGSGGSPVEPVESTVTVDVALKHQTLEGFGAAIAWYQQSLANHAQKDQLYPILFEDL